MTAIKWQKNGSGDFLDGADLYIAPGIVLELATLNDDHPQGWGVWGIRIDGQLYREPRDLEPEPLHDGPLRQLVEARAAAEGLNA